MKEKEPKGGQALVTEDELPEFRQKREMRQKKLRRRRRLIISLALFALISLFVALNWDKLAPSSLANTMQGFFGAFGSGGFPVMISSGDFEQAEPIGSNIGVLTDTSYIIYSQSGYQLARRQHGMSNPGVDAAGGKAVLYDRGGKSLRIETRYDEPFTASMSFPIVTASMSRSGAFAVVTQSDSYLGELKVYDTGYKPVFTWDSSKGHIFAAALSPDGNRVAAVVLTAVNGSCRSSVYIFNTGEKSPLSVTDIDGVALLSIQYVNNDEVAAVGDCKSVFLSANGKKKTEYDYGGKKLKCYTNRDGVTALVFGSYGSGNSSTVVSLSGLGKVLGSTVQKEDILSVFGCDGKLSALTDEGVLNAEATGKSASLTAATGDKLAALPFKKNVYVFGLQAIYRYKLSG